MATNDLKIILSLQDKASKELAGFQGKLEALQPTFRKMALIGTATFGALSAGILATTKSSAQAEGSWNKFNTVFAEGSDEMISFIDELRKTMPTATHEIARMSADLQDLLIPMGLGRKEAMGMTQEMVVLANKLAAFNDVDPTEVLEAFKSGLAGSSEPLRRFGINALDSSIELEAMNTGLLEAGQKFSDLDPILRSQIRAQALVTLAYKQSGDAIEGFEANNDSLIRRQQNLQATMKEISVTIGNVFLPVIDDLVKAITPVIEKIGEFAEENPMVVKWVTLSALALAGLVGAIGGLGIVLLTITPALGFLATAIGGVSTALLFLSANPIGLIITGIGLLIASIYLLVENWDWVKEKTREIWTGISEFFSNWWQGLSDSTQGWLLLIGNILTGGLLGWVRLFIANWDTIKTATTNAWTGIKDFFVSIWDSITNVFDDAIDNLMSKLRPLLRAIDTVIGGAKAIGGKVGGTIKSGFSSAGNFLKNALSVNDAIISPDGNIITTHPDDYLIATKNPHSLAGGGQSIVITGNTLLSEDVAEQIGDMIMRKLKLNTSM